LTKAKEAEVVYTDKAMAEGAKATKEILKTQKAINAIKEEYSEVFEKLADLKDDLAKQWFALNKLASAFTFVGEVKEIQIGNGFSFKRRRKTQYCSPGIFKFWANLVDRKLVKPPSTSKVTKELPNLPREIQNFLSDGSPIQYNYSVGKPDGLDVPTGKGEPEQDE